MKYFNKLLFIIVIFFTFNSISHGDMPYYVDFKFILNESVAGKKAQSFLQKKLTGGVEKLKTKEKNIQEEEKKIIKQKKIISADEYKNKVNDLRKKVSSLKKERDNLFNTVAEQRAKARSELLKNLNPVIKEYMQEKKIRMVIDKKSILLADENLDLTDEIITILNNKLKSIKLD